MNVQPIEKQDLRDNGALQVHSIFHTIQGEGPFCGNSAVFVRLAGCNLQCPGCDTEYTSRRSFLQPGLILELVQEYSMSGLVVITGGEPFRQNISPLVQLLVLNGYYVQIETNGTLPAQGLDYNIKTSEKKGVYMVVSPKTGKLAAGIWNYACAVKYIVRSGHRSEADGLPVTALDHTANPRVARPPSWWSNPIYVQPMDEQNNEANRLNLEAAMRSCMKFPYTLQLQIHKLIGMD